MLDSRCRRVEIDVFKTAHRFGVPPKTLQGQNEEQNWYSAVFVGQVTRTGAARQTLGPSFFGDELATNDHKL
jgi:hypothetical protein